MAVAARLHRYSGTRLMLQIRCHHRSRAAQEGERALHHPPEPDWQEMLEAPFVGLLQNRDRVARGAGQLALRVRAARHPRAKRLSGGSSFGARLQGRRAARRGVAGSGVSCHGDMLTPVPVRTPGISSCGPSAAQCGGACWRRWRSPPSSSAHAASG